MTERGLESRSKQIRVLCNVSRPIRYREVPLLMSGKSENCTRPAVSAEVFCRNFVKTPLKPAQKGFPPNMLLLPKCYRINSHDELLGMARDAHYRNFRTTVPFTPPIPAPLAQTVRQGSMRTILDFLETWARFL